MPTPAVSFHLTSPARHVADLAGSTSFHLTLHAFLSGRQGLLHFYQPIADLKRGVAAGYEVRFRFPSGLGSSTDVIFSAAALLGLDLALEEVVVRQALQSYELLPPDCFLAFTITLTFLKSTHWQAVLADTPTLAGVVLQLSARQNAEDDPAITELFAQVRARGGHVALQESRFTYKSLQHLLDLQPGFIRLARSLVQECHSHRVKSAILEMVGRLSDRSDIWILAEGVDASGELKELLSLGVPLGQGVLLGQPHSHMRPLSTEASVRILAHNSGHAYLDLMQPYVEPCLSRPGEEPAKLLLAGHGADLVVVTDNWNRPLRILQRHPLLGRRSISDLLKVQLTTNPSDAMKRALGRSPESRFDPIVVVDTQGILQGVVRIDKLMSALLAQGKTHAQCEAERDPFPSRVSV